MYHIYIYIHSIFTFFNVRISIFKNSLAKTKPDLMLDSKGHFSEPANDVGKALGRIQKSDVFFFIKKR